MAEREVVYKDVCEERHGQYEKGLAEIKGDVKEILVLLRGRNGDPGLVDRVRDHDTAIKRIWTGTIAIALCVFGNLVKWIFTHFGG